MKIATMARGILPVPRPHDIMYSPLDVAVTISENLTILGHNVTFYGPVGTSLNVTNVETCNLRPIVHNNSEFQSIVASTDLFIDYIPSLYDQALAHDMFKRANKGEFDLLYFHHPESAMPYAKMFPKVPVVYTLHDQLDNMRRETIETFSSPNQHFISISNNQRRGAPDLNYAATVYNGIDLDLFSYEDEAEDYLLTVGRIVTEKGVKEAIQVAQKTDSRLLIIGQVREADKWYFDTYIKPQLNDKILFLGHIDQQQLVRYYQKAKALLMPIQWEEPFGLSMAEAMACGTPVIALKRGSVPEVVADGKTGYIVESIGEMIKAVAKLDKIKRRDCRKHAEKHFSSQKMVEGYETVFKEIIAKSPKKTFHAAKQTGQRSRKAIRSKLGKVKSKLPKIPKNAPPNKK